MEKEGYPARHHSHEFSAAYHPAYRVVSTDIWRRYESVHFSPDPIIFNHQVWEVVRQVPAGRVATYGQVARLLPTPPGVEEKLPGARTALGGIRHGKMPARCPLAAGHQLPRVRSAHAPVRNTSAACWKRKGWRLSTRQGGPGTLWLAGSTRRRSRRDCSRRLPMGLLKTLKGIFVPPRPARRLHFPGALRPLRGGAGRSPGPV